MRIISIDVGIKNLAYCVLERVNNNSDLFNIIQWNVINLCGEEHTCNCPSVKSKKHVKNVNSQTFIINNANICNKKAIFVKNANYYCQTHAKKSDYMLPNSSLKNIKNWKRDALFSYAKVQGIPIQTDEHVKKDSLIKDITAYLVDKCLCKISEVSANDMTLIQMGIKLVKEFDEHLHLITNVDHIIIENQISPIANRMKTLQGMIAQYFIMRNKPEISFISSANKLKLFTDANKTSFTNTPLLANTPLLTNTSLLTKAKKVSTNYGERKKEGVRIVKDLLEKNVVGESNVGESNVGESNVGESNVGNNKWVKLFSSHKKKDDLADAFLQGIWFFKKKISK
jgi:hypothetical protein